MRIRLLWFGLLLSVLLLVLLSLLLLFMYIYRVSPAGLRRPKYMYVHTAYPIYYPQGPPQQPGMQFLGLGGCRSWGCGWGWACVGLHRGPV